MSESDQTLAKENTEEEGCDKVVFHCMFVYLFRLTMSARLLSFINPGRFSRNSGLSCFLEKRFQRNQWQLHGMGLNEEKMSGKESSGFTRIFSYYVVFVFFSAEISIQLSRENIQQVYCSFQFSQSGKCVPSHLLLVHKDVQTIPYFPFSHF